MKKVLSLVLVVLLLTSFTACAKTSNVGGLSNSKSVDKATDKELSIDVKGETYPLAIRDYLKNHIVLDKKPEKVAVLSGTPLNIWYDLGGKSVCTSDVSENIKLIPEYKEEIMKLPKVGAVYSVDMEAIIAEKPDLIIAQVGTQSTQAKKLKDMGFKVITTHIRGFDDVISTYKAFGKILDNTKEAERKIEELKNEKEAFVSKLPSESKSVVILYVTSKSLAVKLDNSIAGDVAKILKLKNIASDLPADTIGSETTPLDIEYIVGKNPDYVLVTSMISSNEEAKKSMENHFKSNPVWKGVKGISEGRVVYLPQEYFLYNAGPYYNEAIEYMARSVYPEVYGELTEWYGK
ncbi:ABC transporter substrate-binding protein [Clostridium malenominatum]|uniref:ABC transporter substrate-binding protein n=1 Tax=Clostridium malenominatum TaxID=1539 RepID=A0ABP3TXZ8_9CLOT